MNQEVECIDCGFEFESNVFDHNPNCPKCKRKFYWDSQYNDVEGDFYFPVWD